MSTNFWNPLLNSIGQQNLPLIHLQLPFNIGYPNIPLPSSLVYLSVGFRPTLTISSLPNLRYLKFGASDANGLDFNHTSLEELHFKTSLPY